MSHLHSCKSSNNNDMQQKIAYKQDGISNPVNDQGNAVRNEGHFDISACINRQTWDDLMHAMETSGSETGQRQCVPIQRISNQSPFGDLIPNLKDNLYTKETRYNGPLCSSKFGWEHINGKSESFTSQKLDSTDSNIVQKKRGNNKNSLKQDQKQVIRDSFTAKNHSDGNSNLKFQSIQTPPGFAPIEVRDISGSALRLVQKPDYPSQLENKVSQDGAHKVVTSRPRKRKAAATSALPSGIRTKELKWTRASDMLINKREDATPIMNDKSSLNRGRKRLILMTQLTQELIPSVPKIYLKSDATMNYKNVVYHVAKSALGGACTLVSPKDPLLNLKNEDRNFQESKTQLKEESLLSFTEACEDIIKRSETLESDFARLDERSSVLYVQLWWNELEKLTIVNRLINIHGGNTLQRHMIERHVTVFRLQIDTNINALAVPCLSL